MLNFLLLIITQPSKKEKSYRLIITKPMPGYKIHIKIMTKRFTKPISKFSILFYVPSEILITLTYIYINNNLMVQRSLKFEFALDIERWQNMHDSSPASMR